MKGLLNLLTLLAALLDLTAGCGLAARGRAGARMLQLGSAITRGSLGAGTTGGSLVSDVNALLGSGSSGVSLAGIRQITASAGGASIGVGGLDSRGTGSALGSIVSGLSGNTGGSLLASVGRLAVNHLSRGGSGGAVGPLPSITGSGGNAGILLGQGFQQSGHMVAGQIVGVAGGVVTTAANSATSFGRRIAGNPSENTIDLVASQSRGHSVGFTSTGGGIPTSNGPATGGGPRAVAVPGNGIAAGLLGGSGLGGLPAGGLPGGVSSLGSVSSSSISASGMGTVQRIGQTLQRTGQTLGTGSLSPGGTDITSAVTSTVQHAGHTLGTYVGVAANPNGAGSGGRALRGGTGPGSTGTHPGPTFPAGPNQGQGPAQGVQPNGQLLGRRSFVVGTSSQHSTTSTTNIQGNGVGNGMNVEQGGRPTQIGGPLGGAPFPSGGAALQSGTHISEDAIRNSVDVTASLNSRSSGVSALTPGGGLGPGGPISGTGFPAETNLGQGPGQGVQPIDQLLRTRSFVVGTSSQHSTTSTTNIQGNGVGNGMNVAPGNGPPQSGRPLGGLAGGAAIESGTQIGENALRNSLHVVSTINSGGSGGSALSPGGVPGSGGLISGQSAGLAVTNSEGVLSDLRETTANGLGRGTSSSGLISVSSNSISGSSFPARPNQRQGPVQGVQPTDQMLGGGSFVASSSSHQSTTSTTTSIQGNGVGNGRIPGPGFERGAQTANHVPGGASIVAVSSSSHSQSRWGARIVQSTGGSLGNGLPNLASAGPGGIPSTVPSGLGSPGTNSGLLTAIVGAATTRGTHGGPGAAPGGSLGVFGSSGSSLSGSSGVTSGIGQAQIARKPHGRQPSAAAAAGIALGVVAGTLALGAIGSGIAGALHSGMAGGGRQGGGCPRRGCGGGCGRKRRSVLQSKVPAEVLNNIPMDFNMRY